MNELIIYLLKVVIIQGLFFLMYWLFFRNTVNHSLNRLYLLAVLAFSFMIPFVELSYFKRHVPTPIQDSPVIGWFSSPSIEKEFILQPIETSGAFSWLMTFPTIYCFITLILVGKSTIYLMALQKLKKNSERIHKRWFTIFKTSQNRPFSFLRNVFIPTTLFGSSEFDQVVAHECVHVRRFHSVDRLFLDFAVSLLWFNPFIYCYRKALIEIHEYQADEGVLKQYNDPIGYQEVLFSQLQSPHYSGLVSHFNFQMIKKRIVMMNKEKKRTGWVYGLTVPVILMITLAFSNQEAMKPINNVGDEISSFIGPVGDMKAYADLFLQRNDEPSILPLKERDMVRMTSGFGMRMHPVEKVKKMHFGMDFACQIGTEVIATADGKIAELRNSTGYGKLIIIDHGSNGFETYYAQLSEFKVMQGDEVKKGQVIALSGNSGMSSGPHLHYEVKREGHRVDPATYIKNYSFTEKLGDFPPHEHADDDEASVQTKKKETQKQELTLGAEEIKRRETELLLANEQNRKEEKELEQVGFLLAQEKELEIHRRLKEEELKAEEERKRLEEEIFGGKGPRPLYIVDGQEIEELIGFDPAEIESVDVLKGENALNRYGEKAKNGVVVIKKKNPKEKNKIKNKQKDKSKVKNKK